MRTRMQHVVNAEAISALVCSPIIDSVIAKLSGSIMDAIAAVKRASSQLCAATSKAISCHSM